MEGPGGEEPGRRRAAACLNTVRLHSQNKVPKSQGASKINALLQLAHGQQTACALQMEITPEGWGLSWLA